jgi:hemerythrin-like domain-containing protein
MTGHPIDVLMNEHRLIETVLDAIEERVASLGGGGRFPQAFFAQALDFLASFADGTHHYKEEQALFPALVAKGLPREGGPIGCMLAEHVTGREHISAIRSLLPEAAAGDETATQELARHAMEYVGLLRAHIRKEDQVLFQMALNLLSEQEFERIAMRFRSPGDVRLMPEFTKAYTELAAQLTAA